MGVTNKRTEYLSMRINGELKREFWDFCDNLHTNASALVAMLARKCVREESIPFEVISPEIDFGMRYGTRGKGGGNADERVSFRMDNNLRLRFSAVCEEHYVSMSVVVRAFMVQCIEKGRLPFSYGKGDGK